MSSDPKILAVATLTPPYKSSVEDVVEKARQWVAHRDEAFQAKVLKIFRNAQVDERYTVLPLDDVFAERTLAEKNAIYRREIVQYAERAMTEALEKAGLGPQDIDCLITTSCTGHMSPSLDAFLVNRLGMKPSVQRLPVTEMGCMGGAAGLIYAENYLRAYPDRYVALVSAELTTITFQRDDFSWANIVSTAIFADGVACAILGPTPRNAPAIVGSAMHQVADTTDLLGFELANTGFRMVLDEALPACIHSHFDAFLQPLLEEHQTDLSQIQHFVLHPGGKKIVHDISQILRRYDKNLDDSKAVLRQYGNLSSATVLFILARFLDRDIPEGEKGLILGFGPGFTASSILLEWQNGNG